MNYVAFCIMRYKRGEESCSICMYLPGADVLESQSSFPICTKNAPPPSYGDTYNSSFKREARASPPHPARVIFRSWVP